MPRPLRIEFEHAWYHVMNRGINRQTIFESASHKSIFYSILDEVTERFKIEIHAFCLMENHYHLLIKTPYANLSRVMRHLDGVYTQRFNRATHRDGPLFRGRYKAILVESDEYHLQVSRYIHLNPVVAKLCSDPLDYEWSSYRSFVNEKPLITWLNTSFTLNQMPGHDKLSAYASFVNQGTDQETVRFYKRKHLSSIYGSKKFIEKQLNILDKPYIQSVFPDINHTKPLPTKEEILDSVTKYFHITENKLKESIQGKRNLPKLITIYLLSKLTQLNHKGITEIFTSLRENSIPHQLIRIKKKISGDKEISKYVTEIANIIEKSHPVKHDH